jgi:hypothetical protein
VRATIHFTGGYDSSYNNLGGQGPVTLVRFHLNRKTLWRTKAPRNGIPSLRMARHKVGCGSTGE